MERLLRPASVAVVGASERPGAYGGEALLNLQRLGYRGRTFAVNPGRSAVHGIASYPSLEDLPVAPDAVVVALPAGLAAPVVASARAMGCGGAVVFAAGFAEAHAVDLQRSLTEAADGLPVCGPNGNGIVSLPDRVALWGDALVPREAGAVALISQSGNVAVNALASRRGLRLHTVVSCGNQAVLGAAEFVEAVLERDGVRSIALYLEADGDGAQWARALARCAGAGVGVAVLKAGRSRAGAAAAEAHTGALAGDHRVFRALFEECGALWAEDPHDLLELAKGLAVRRRRPASPPRDLAGAAPPAVATTPAVAGATPPAVAASPAVAATRPGVATPPAVAAPPSTPGSSPAASLGVAVMTCSGGDSAVAADLAAELGVALPALAPATLTRLRAILPAAATAANPLDYTSLLWDEPDALRELIVALADDPAVGRVLVLYDAADGSAPVLDAVAAAGVDVALASTLPELLEDATAAELIAAGVPAYAGLRSALRALRAPRRPRALASRVDGGRAVGEPEAKALLRRAGLPVVAGRVTHDAVAAWRELGGPVAVKRVGVVHKAREGGVALGLDDEAAVREAGERLGPTVLVERMAPPGVEVLVAIRRDGLVPVLVIGLGGVWTEALDDVAVVPLPVDETRVIEALGTLRAAAMIPAAPVAELAVALQHLPLALIELNPVIVGAHGAVAVDALAQEVLT